MLTQLISAIFLLSFLAQSFTQSVIIGNYYANTATYAQNCINKAKPAMHCNGKCQMMKKLKQEEKKDQQNPQRRNTKEEVLSSKSFFAATKDPFNGGVRYYSPYPVAAPTDRSVTFFHPPAALGFFC